MRAITLATIAVLILVGGYWAWSRTQMAQPTPTQDVTPAVIQISYSDDGYQPNEVTIRQGEKVEWINNSSKDMWPASAIHPTHSLYPEKKDSDCLGSSFDACGHLSPGAAWEYTFTVIGDWRFHDHIRPSKTGIVHVVE